MYHTKIKTFWGWAGHQNPSHWRGGNPFSRLHPLTASTFQTFSRGRGQNTSNTRPTYCPRGL